MKMTFVACSAVVLFLAGCSDSHPDFESKPRLIIDDVIWESHSLSGDDAEMLDVVLLADMDRITDPKESGTPVRLTVTAIIEPVPNQNEDSDSPVFWKGLSEMFDEPSEKFKMMGRAVKGLTIDAWFESPAGGYSAYILTRRISDELKSSEFRGIATDQRQFMYGSGHLNTNSTCADDSCSEVVLAGGKKIILLSKPSDVTGLKYQRSTQIFPVEAFGF